ncbi:hypothetical protein FQA39_LY17368 [Lamprigera yunnana]|nr:hypothetical protein FQA39_LY17368 [Lamprigera yunnana]
MVKMNSVNSFIEQQIGFSKMNNYDGFLKRLTSRKEDQFLNLVIQPSQIEQLRYVDPPIFACRFAHVRGYQHILGLANEDGKIAIWNTKTNERYGRGVHSNAIFDIAWMPKVMKLVTASGDHTAALYDISNGSITCERCFQGHVRSLKSVACRPEDNFVFATGSRDGKIFIWDIRASQSHTITIPDVSIPMTHFPCGVDNKSKRTRDAVSASSSVTGLVFKDYSYVISCGAGDGLIKVWDIRKTYYSSQHVPTPIHTLPYAGTTLRNGFSNLLLNSNGTKLYASCLDNVIYVYNVLTYNPKPIMELKGHKNSTFYVKTSLSHDDKYILSGSSDNTGYIWNVSQSEPLVQLVGHDAEVTSVSWCEDGTNVLVTCSDDLTHRLWRVDVEVVPENMKSSFTNRAVEVYHKSKPVLLTRKRKNIFTSSGLCIPSNKSNILYDEFLAMNSQEETGISVLTSPIKKTKMQLSFKRKLSTSTEKHDDDDNTTKRIKFHNVLSNLPNFVVDGISPHLNLSPEKKPERDWLTKLRIKRCSVTQMHVLSRSSPTKIIKIDGSPSSKRKQQKTEISSPSSQRPLLQYFKLTSSTSPSCRAKSPNCITSSQKSQTSQ